MACIVSVAIIKFNSLNPNILSALYLRLSAITTNHLRRCVVAFSVNFDSANMIPHLSLKYSFVVFECHPDDMNVRGCLISSGFSGGSGTTPSVTLSPSFSLFIIYAIQLLETNSATRLCLSIVLHSILFDWVPDTRTLDTIFLFNSCASKIKSSSSTTGVSPGFSSYCLKFMARLEMFHDSISSFT